MTGPAVPTTLKCPYCEVSQGAAQLNEATDEELAEVATIAEQRKW